jgi:TRAP-type transport system small permease protein
MTTKVRRGFIDLGGEILAILAGISLIFMVLVIAVGVVMRFVLAMPILGANEIVQLTAVAVVALALPHCTSSDGHVRVDVLDQAIGPVGRLIGDVLSRLLSIIVLGVVAWRASLKSLDALKYGDATNMLSLPIWPFYGLLAFGVTFAALALAIQLVEILTRKVHQ